MIKFNVIKKWYLLKPILISAVVLLSYFILMMFSNGFNIAGLKTQDVFSYIKYKLKPLAKDVNDVVIVCIDDRSYEEFNRKWPWGREVFTVLVYNLAKCQPKAIGLNLAFAGQSNIKGVDSFLADAFREAGNVVIASYFNEKWEYQPPDEIFLDAVSGYGFTNRPIDLDGVVRQIRIFARSDTGEISGYSFELKLLEVYLGMHIRDVSLHNDRCVLFFENSKENKYKKISIPVNPDGTARLQYNAKPMDFLNLSIIDVLAGNVPEVTLKNRIILVGMTSKVFQDEHATPLGIMSGAALIANAFISLLRQDFIIEAPKVITHIMVIFLSLVVGIITYRFTLTKSTICLLLFIILFFLLGILLVFFGIVFDFFSILFISFTTYVFINIYKYVRLLIESVILKRAVISDPITGLATKRYFQVRLHHDLNRAISEKESLVLVIFDIDNFSQITGNVGSDRIDEIIREIGRIIQRHSRRSRGVDFICRYGEKEFSVILHKTTQKGTQAYTQRIQKAISQFKSYTDIPINISLSAGVAVYPLVNTKSPDALINCAIAALKRGEKKESGGISFYNHEIDNAQLDVYKEKGGMLQSEIDMEYIISDMEERNKELITALRDLRKAHGDIIKTERIAAMGKVTAQIHHELNKPLGNLKDCLEIIQAGIKERSEIGKYIQLAISEVERMGKLNTELRDFYRPHKKEMVEVEIHNIMDEMLNLSKKHLMVNKIRLNKQYAERIPKILGYPEELKQVFLNMIINAIDAMPNSGELTILTNMPLTDTLEIYIKDTGCGISKENMDKLFQPFFTTKDETRGSGLGLYASKQIIEHHGGRIKVQSEVGQGSTFIISLPVKFQVD